MKNILKGSLLTSIILFICSSTAMATAESGSKNFSLLAIIFLAFVAVVIVFQAIPGLVMFFSMIKGLFPSSTKKLRSAANGDGKPNP